MHPIIAICMRYLVNENICLRQTPEDIKINTLQKPVTIEYWQNKFLELTHIVKLPSTTAQRINL